MAYEMDWSHDYCLYCDKQTSEGVYCSQSCRLADLEKAGGLETSSPSYSLESGFSSSWQSTSTRSSNASQFQLTPALNFSALRSNFERHHHHQHSPPSSPQSPGITRHSYFASNLSSSSSSSASTATRMADSRTHDKKRSLNASSSRSSLSSISSSSNSGQGLSSQALSQLRGYSNSFDQVRDWKRRVTVG